MEKILHIINGDAAADTIKASGVPGDTLVWRDVLHDGPVPAGLSLEDLSEVRAKFLSETFQVDSADTLRDFQLRDTHLTAADKYERIILWFEHDLYDQLQLLQVLDWFHDHSVGDRLHLICIDHFPGIEPFYGLGQLDVPDFETLFGQEVPVTTDTIKIGSNLWRAFRADRPVDLDVLAKQDHAGLPFMRSALCRFLAEYPSVETGLGKTEQMIVDLISQGTSDPVKLFQMTHETEDAPFMGDWSFWHLIRGLMQGQCPLIERDGQEAFSFPDEFEDIADFRSQVLGLTPEGQAVQQGKADRVDLQGYDRWFGGVHLTSENLLCRWDHTAEMIVQRTDDAE